VEGLTLVPDARLVALGRLVDGILDRDVPGDVVECGVWRGGASFFMCDVLDHAHDPRRVWMFDSFEGLPAPLPIDGEKANTWVANPNVHPRYRNNIAPLDEVREAAWRLGHTARCQIVKGWFADTLPETAQQIGPIALLRLDGDWYESTKTCLEALYDQVSVGGVIIADDYLTYDGCAVALHEFLGGRMLAHRLRETAGHVFLLKT
jgi:O-methyltransferase